MSKKWIHDHKGMSLVEIIIVIEIIGILAGSSIAMFNIIKSANVKDTAATIDSQLDQLQMHTMSKSGNPFLYIYKLSDGYYTKVLNVNLASFDSTQLNTDGKKVAGNDIEIYRRVTGTTDELIDTSGNFIRIAYRKSMEFSSDTNTDSIVIDGKASYEISLMKETGKHIMK